MAKSKTLGGAAVTAGKVTITVEERDLREIEARVVQYVGDEIIRRAGDSLLKDAHRVAHERLVATLGSKVEQVTREVLEKGWSEVSRWGEPSGKVWTLRGHITELLQREDGEFGRRAKFIDRIVTQAVEQKLAGEFASVVADAKEKFKTAVDGVVTAKLKETLSRALGLG